MVTTRKIAARVIGKQTGCDTTALACAVGGALIGSDAIVSVFIGAGGSPRGDSLPSSLEERPDGVGIRFELLRASGLPGIECTEYDVVESRRSNRPSAGPPYSHEAIGAEFAKHF